MCGIFGHATNNPKRLNPDKVKILGMYNETRGKTSCGISYDGEIFHGMDKDKLFSDFIKGRPFKPRKFPVMIGHTRQASVGIVSRYNCHPFGFDENNEGDYKFIGVHNGTLYNHKELAEKFEVEVSAKYISDYNNELSRDKIDSEIILEILKKTKNFKVLSEYNGRAALVWTDTDNPNIVYLWSGKSVPNFGDDISKAEEERPLNVFIESKNSFFFSSLPEALYAIGGDPKNTFQIDYNTVYVVKDGDFKAAQTVRVSRKNNFHIESWSKKGYTSTHGTTTTPDAGINSNFNRAGFTKNRSVDYGYNKIPFKNNLTTEKDVIQLPVEALSSATGLDNIYHDSTIVPENEYGDRIFSKKLRYYRNGHLIDGIYIWIMGYGFYLLTEDWKKASFEYMKIVGQKFVDGEFDFFNRNLKEGMVPFQNATQQPTFYYFLEGCMLRDQGSYTTWLSHRKELKAKGKFMEYESLSFLSTHPIVDLTVASQNPQKILHNGKLFNGEVDNLGFDKKYTIVKGSLTETKRKLDSIGNKIKAMIEAKAIAESPKEVGSNCKVKTKFNQKIMAKCLVYFDKFEKNIALEEQADDTEESLKNFLDSSNEPEGLEEEINYVEPVTTSYFDTFEGDIVKEEDVIEIIQGTVDEHFTEIIVNLQDCRRDFEKLQKRFGEHADIKEVLRLTDDMSKIMNDYIIN